MKKIGFVSPCLFTIILQAMEVPNPKPLAVCEQEIIHLDLPFSYSWGQVGFLPIPYLLRHHDGRIEEGESKKFKKEILCALIRSRLLNNQSLDMPICYWDKKGRCIARTAPALIKATADDYFISVTQQLLANGANVNVCFGDISPLERAVSYGQVKTVTVLLGAGADCKNKLLLHKCPLDNNDIIKLLLKHGVNPNERDGEGRTALFSRDGFGSPSSIDLLVKRLTLLLDWGAEINTRDDLGSTPLAYFSLCTSKIRKPLFVLFNQRGAWSYICDDNGRSWAGEWIADCADDHLNYLFNTERQRFYTMLRNDKRLCLARLPADLMRIIVALVYKSKYT